MLTALLIDKWVYTDDSRKLQGYWADSHQIYTECSQIIPIECFEIKIVIFQSISECHGDE